METSQITVNIPNAYCDTFVKMFDGMGFEYRVKRTKPRTPAKTEPKPDSKEYVMQSILRGMEEVKLWKEGKLKLPTLEEVLNEM